MAFFMWLLAGIKIDTFNVADYNVNGLYIKLDKKLILKAESVTIPESKKDPSLVSVDETFDRIKYLLTFFESIDLQTIIFKNNRLSIKFRDDYLELTSKDYEIVGTVQRKGKMIKATIPFLNVKKHQVSMHGEFTYDLHEDVLATKGSFTFNGATGKFNARKKGNDIDFGLSSDTFTDLKSIINRFGLMEVVRSWVVDKVQAKEYKLQSLSGKAKIDKGKFTIDLDALKGEVIFSDAKIYFQKELAPVLVPRFILTYERGGLYFDLKEPTYENISLEGSHVSILNLLNPHTNLKLKIRTHTAYDDKVQNLLKAYDLELPIHQENGKANVLFMADINLKNTYQDFFVNVDFDQSDIWFEKLKFPIEKGNLQYKKGFITLKNIYLKDALYEGKLDGQIDLDKKKADLIFDARTITVDDEKEKFFVLNNETLPFTLSYEENIEVEIPKLHFKLVSDQNETHLFLTDLNKIKPYLPSSVPIEDGGNVHIKTKDFQNFTFKGVLKRSSCFLYEKNDQCKTKVYFNGQVTKKNLNVFAFNKRFHYNKAKSRIKLTNLNLDLEKFLESEDQKPNKKAQKKKEKTKQGKSIIVLGKNSHLRYGDYRLMTDSYDIEIKPNGNIKAIGSAQKDIIKFTKKQELVSIRALRIKDKTLHPLINFKGLQNGRYTLKVWGDPGKTMKGEIIVEGGMMKDFKAYNNTLAFINTVPALASLQNPGYSQKGFTIEEGVAEYRMVKKDKIIFDSIYIKGTSATIAGTGEIDLKKKTINMNLAIQTAREIGKLVGSVPIVGYVLMGGDKSMTFGLQITGNLDNPQVQTSAGKDILSLPMKLLQRAVESTENIINK